jgi:alcohol dehydrogenase (NADP+)
VYPVVPGHEIVGHVTAVGKDVKNFKPGDRVGVGCLVDSCRKCGSCESGLEQYCERGWVGTYNGKDLHDGSRPTAATPSASWSASASCCACPDALDPAAAAPLLCAGITTWSPLKHFGVGKGHRVGVVGMGGLGHMGVKFARALGAEVTVFTRTVAKVEEAKKQGAHHVVVSTNDKQMAAAVALRLHPRHGAGAARPQSLRQRAQARRHADPGRPAGPIEPRCRPSRSCSAAGASPAR